ncbi:HAMP domain-containing sensor histidine kinase [Clostridium massiliodielmoense]|uniref:HAMP domain-containing sensor histidine kinase n=1 Tax=Clostridium massiliodielmoense TaxID=1776385 RepID=UPI000A2726B0|nr:HAMP domain-containing sensor histidine kinase [Clostridium massiliodielmoense]
MFGLKRQNKRVYTTTFKQYIIFLLLIVMIFSIGIGAIFVGIGKLIDSSEYKNDINKFYKAKVIIKGDYKNIDAKQIMSIGGWVEILNNNKDVVHIIGKKKDKKMHYSEDELLLYVEQNLDIDKIDNSYLYSIAPFHFNNKKYYCVVKVPNDTIRIDIDKKNSMEKYINKAVSKILKGILCITLLLVLVILIYSSWVSRRIVRPLREILKGISKMTEGDYGARISFKRENEFSEIKDAFNFMAEKIQQGDIERKKNEQFKQQLFTDISHDLKTPITSIQGYSKALYDGVVQDDVKKQKYINIIYNKSRRLTSLIENVHELAKLGNGNYFMCMENTDMCEFLREVVTDFYFEIEEKNFECDIDIPERPIMHKIDRNEFTRVIANIMSNSIKYNPCKTRFKVGLQKNDFSISIIIADDGIGITDEIKETIFEAFTRGDLSRVSTGGTGIGLSIARKIVEKHNGCILLKSNDEYKTIFEIILNLG